MASEYVRDPSISLVRQLCRSLFLPAWTEFKKLAADQLLYWALCFMDNKERRMIGHHILEFLRRDSNAK